MKRKRDCPGVGNGKVGPQAGYIDDHPDFWRYHPRGYGSIDESMAWLRPDFLPSDREPGLRRKGVPGWVPVQARQAPEETQWLLDLASEASFILGVVGWVDLKSPRLVLRGSVGGESRAGRNSPYRAERTGRPMPASARIPRYMAMLEEFGLACDILPYPRHLGVAVEFARRFPGQRFILDHFANS